MSRIEIGRLLRAGTTGFVIGCRVTQLDSPSFGCIVRAPLDNGYEIYGIIHDIHIDDDGLVRQLVTAEGVDENIIADNRINRNVPVEMSVLAIGFCQGGQISHRLPPRPPLSLDVIYLCSKEEVARFTGAGRFGYFRHILRDPALPVGDLLAAHIAQAQEAHSQSGDPDWSSRAAQELITLLRDDYAMLMNVLSALGDVISTNNRS
jgi:hypothetical protein